MRPRATGLLSLQPSARRAKVRWISRRRFEGDRERGSPTHVERAGATSPLGLLEGSLGVGVRRFFSEDECRAWVAGVHAGRDAWVSDFGGEQFSLGRAFYTHLEQGRSRDYFADAKGSDARVEQLLPGLQRRMLALFAQLVGGHAAPRRGWCGPGVHIFPAGETVSREGGVVHFDTEGLAEAHIEERRPAVTVVAMLQPPEGGGGLRLWDIVYDGCDEVADAVALRAASAVARYGPGDVLAIDSYRLHQIRPFRGTRSRISATVHGAEIDRGRWETWF